MSISVLLDADCELRGGSRLNFHPGKGELLVLHCRKMAHTNALFGGIIQRARPNQSGRFYDRPFIKGTNYNAARRRVGWRPAAVADATFPVCGIIKVVSERRRGTG